MVRALKIVGGLTLALSAEVSMAQAECFGLAKGPIVFDLITSEVVSSSKSFLIIQYWMLEFSLLFPDLAMIHFES